MLEQLGIRVETLQGEQSPEPNERWDEATSGKLRAAIAAREPFLDFLLTRTNADGSRQHFRVSGEPMFNEKSQFLGYRGIGIEVLSAT